MTVSFKQVDVFTSRPFEGNPVAVVLDAARLTDSQMQTIARWTNLSETTFVTRPTRSKADYAVRIFTPGGELPFAGHPTLGTVWALMEDGLEPQAEGCFMQECAIGLIPIRVESTSLFFALPKPNLAELSASEVQALASALGVAIGDIHDVAIVSVGPIWLTAQLGSPQQVVDVCPDMSAIRNLNSGQHGVCIFGVPENNRGEVEVRSFAPAMGVPEDPVCGSGNGAVAAILQRAHGNGSGGYIARQGRCVGRDGRVTVRYAPDGVIWVGGEAVTCISGGIVSPVRV